MCRIAGVHQQVNDEVATKKMGRCLDHRGPDEESLFSYRDDRIEANFAQRRLSIINLQYGQQPLAKRPYVLCYNGEPYIHLSANGVVDRLPVTAAGLGLRHGRSTKAVVPGEGPSTEVGVRFVDPTLFRAAFSLSAKDRVSGRTSMVALKRVAESAAPETSRAPTHGVILSTAPIVGDSGSARADQRLVAGWGPGRLRISQTVGDDRTGRRPSIRTRGPFEADLAAPHARVLVSPNPPSRGRAVTPHTGKESDDK
jgi:hypothetical protein